MTNANEIKANYWDGVKAHLRIEYGNRTERREYAFDAIKSEWLNVGTGKRACGIMGGPIEGLEFRIARKMVELNACAYLTVGVKQLEHAEYLTACGWRSLGYDKRDGLIHLERL